MGKAWMPLNNFKKVHEDGTKAILQHPDGHQITLAKSILSPAMKQQLSSLPQHQKMSRGGKIKKMDDGGDPGGGAPDPSQQTPLDMPGISSPNPLGGQQQQQQGQQQQPTPNRGNPDLGQQQQQGPDLNTQVMGIKQQEAAQNAKIQGDLAAKMQKMIGVQTGAYSSVMKDGQDIKNYILDHPIDPNRYFGDMSTAGKISTAIGVFLGGLGAGKLGSTHNNVLEYVNDAIKRDIAVQQQNLDNKTGLLKINMEIHKNMADAATATFGQMSSVASALTLKNAADSDNQMMKQIGSQLAGKFDGQQHSAAQNLANRITAKAMGYDPDKMMNTPNGAIYGANDDTRKEFSNIQSTNDAINGYKQQIQGGQVLLNPAQRQAAESARYRLAQEMAVRSSGQEKSRYNEQEINEQLKRIPPPKGLLSNLFGKPEARANELQNEENQRRNSIISNQTQFGPQTPITRPMGGQ